MNATMGHLHQAVTVVLLGCLAFVPVPAAGAPFGYIANGGAAFNGNVSVIDIAKDSVVATITGTGMYNFGIAINPARNRVYVGDWWQDGIYIIDSSTNTVVNSVQVGSSPTGIAVSPDGTRVYVSNRASNTVSVIDAVSEMVVATIPVGPGPYGLAVTPDGSKVYVANSSYPSNTVSVIDTVTNVVVATVPSGFVPTAVVIHPSGNPAYVVNEGQYTTTPGMSSVSVIDTATDTVVASIGGLGAVSYGGALNSSGSRLYVTNYESATVAVIETATNSIVTQVGVGGNPVGLSVTPDGRRVYVAEQGTNSISVIDATTNLFLGRIPGGPTPLAWGNFIGPGNVTSWPAPVTIDPNGYRGQLCVANYGCTAGGGQTRTFALTPGSYSLTDAGSRPLTQDTSAAGGFQLDGNGIVTLDAVASQHFYAVGGTIHARVVLVKVNFNSYPGTVSFRDVAQVTGPSLGTFQLIIGRRYRFTDPNAIDLVALSSDFSAQPYGVSLSLDGTAITLDADTARHFTAAGTTLTARVAPVTLNLNGYSGVVDWLDIAHVTGTQTKSLIVGRRYYLAAGASVDLVRNDGKFSAAPSVALSLDGTSVSLETETAQHFTVSGTTITAIVAPITLNRNGYLGPVAWTDVVLAAGTRSLIVGRRYFLSDTGGVALSNGAIRFSAYFGVGISMDGGTVTLDADTSRHFTASGATVAAKTIQMTVDPNGDPASFCLTLIMCGPGGGQRFTASMIIGRRYQLSPGGSFAVDFTGCCTPSVIPHNGFNVLLY